MMQKEMEKILELSVDQRILMVEEIWDSIAQEPDSVQITENQKKELDQRLEAYKKNPHLGSSWEEVKSKLLSL